MSEDGEAHVKFVQIDPDEENERSMRGFEHRKDLVVRLDYVRLFRYVCIY